MRHTDGSYTKAYHVSMPATLYAEGETVERCYNDWARALQSIKQHGCIVQLRHDAWPDSGRALAEHIRAQAHAKDTYVPARMLHTVGLTGTESAARAAQYQDDRLTLWVRVPVRHANDPSRARLSLLASFLPALAKDIRKQGLAGLLRAAVTAWTRTNVEALCVRSRLDEEAACEAASQLFAAVEHMCPLELRSFTREEMWREVYRSHRLNERAAPALPLDETADLRQYLCGEEIRGSGQFILHGDYPVTIVSLFRPPTPVISAGMLRVMTANPNLVFRHTTVVEYLTLDQEKAKTHLKNQFKDLSRAQRAVTRKSPTPGDDDPEVLAAQQDIRHLREEMAGGRESLIEARVYVVVYGERARTRAELYDSIKRLDEYCRHVVSALGRIPGADAAREAPAALRALYPQMVAGEASAERTGREFTETTRALARLAPFEGVWRGSPRPVTLVTTPSNHLIGFDLFDANEVPSPLGLLLAGSRGGKSVLLSEIITNALATIKKLRVRVVDYGNSQEPLVAALGGRHLKFDPQERATINVWDYKGLEQGEPPTELQKWYVVQDALQLARVDTADTSSPYARFAEDILTLMVREVYHNEVPRNGLGKPKQEPRHEHLLEMLATYQFEDVEADAVRTQLRIALETFRGDPFLDAPTSREFAAESPLDVYEMKSLESFSDRVRQSLAFRIVARVIQSEGHREPDGTRTKMLLAFDEMWEYTRGYPRVVAAIDRYARTGGKEGVLTLLATQAFKDITGTPEAPNPIGHSLMSNVGVKFIGVQTGDYADMARKFKFSDATSAAIDSIKNMPGRYSEFVGVWGAGAHQQVQKFRVVLNSSLKLWTYTSNSDERNARRRVQYLRPHWHPVQVYMWLAEHYPQGLVAAGLTQIDEALLDAEAFAA
ncbi:MAG: VirB4 family type IV secretion system protein [Pyrinomonadaceae bacterium]